MRACVINGGKLGGAATGSLFSITLCQDYRENRGKVSGGGVISQNLAR